MAPAALRNSPTSTVTQSIPRLSKKACVWGAPWAMSSRLGPSATTLKALVRAAAQGHDEDSLWKMQEPLSKKVFSSNDAKEGPAAFAEKRAPNWTGT